jgi:hypothetical protein
MDEKKNDLNLKKNGDAEQENNVENQKKNSGLNPKNSYGNSEKNDGIEPKDSGGNSEKNDNENPKNDGKNSEKSDDKNPKNDGENLEKNDGIEPRKNGGLERENNSELEQRNDAQNSEKKLGIAEKFKRYFEVYKGLPRGRKQKVVSLVAAVLLIVIVAPIVVGSLVASGGERYLLSVESDGNGGILSVEAAGKKTDGGILVQVGATVCVKAEVQPHYSFVGWFNERGQEFPDANSYLETEFSFKMIKADLKLRAVFSLDTNKLKVTSKSDVDGATGGKFDVRVDGKMESYRDMDTNTFERGYEEGREITLSVSTKSKGYDFWGWFEGEERLSGDAAYSFTTGAEERDIEARFYKAFGAGEGIAYDIDSDLLAPSSGSGILEDPYVYEISTKEQLALFADRINTKGYYSEEEDISPIVGVGNLSETFVLVDDINLCGAEWTPIGSFGNKFKYIFDGDGHEIANFKINYNTSEAETIYAGLFGYITYGGAEIKNLKISGVEIKITASNAEVYAGAVAGKIEGALSENLTVVGGSLEIKGNTVYAGMITGEIASPMSTSGLHAVDKVTGKTTTEAGKVRAEARSKERGYVGGLAGYFNGNGIKASSSTAAVWSSVTATSSGHAYAGSILGACSGGNIDLSGATATGKVDGAVGGKVGGMGIAK